MTTSNTSNPTYSTRSAARKGASRKGLNVDALLFEKTISGRWIWLSATDKEMVEIFGHSHCPDCGVSLENGVGEHGQDVNGTIVKHSKHQFECLGCGSEFGPAIKKSKPVTGVKIEKNRDEQNGVKRPSVGSKCRFVWDLCDAMLNINGNPPSHSAVKSDKSAKDLNPATVRTQYARWRKFNGLTGRLPVSEAAE